jgi:tetratricopeptide (TPR) repeat protein
LVPARAQSTDADICKTGKSDAARDACTRLIDQGSLAGAELADVHYRRALAYIALYKRPLAVADLDRAIALAPDFAAAYVARASARRTNSNDLENMQMARVDYDKAVALDPNSYEAVHFRGTFRDWMKDYAGAIADYTRALEIKPDDINSLHMRERAWRHVGEFAKALADSERLIVLDPKFNERLLNRASAYLAVGELDRALIPGIRASPPAAAPSTRPRATTRARSPSTRQR